MANNNPTFGLPSPTASDEVWYAFFARLAQLSAESPIQSVTVVARPFTYTASTIGDLLVTNTLGVSDIKLTRGGTTVDCTGAVFIPMAANDIVTVTYSSAPTVSFVPSARA